MMSIDPLVAYTDEQRKTAGLGAPKILADLLVADVHVSPLLVYVGNKRNIKPVEPAFVLLRPKTGSARATVALCALVDVWSIHRKDASRRREISAHASGGALIRRTANAGPSEAGDVLFGRYLCGDSLAYREQRALLVHLRDTRYPSAVGPERKAVHDVVKCISSTLHTPLTQGLMRVLVQREDWASADVDTDPEDLVFLRELLLTYVPTRRNQFV
jgi:hypothetical protein